MNKSTINIRGMHCRSCEMLIEEKLSEIPGVDKSNVNFRKGTADIFYSARKPDSKKIEEAIRSAGYSPGKTENGFLSFDANDYRDLAVAFIVFIVFYLLAKWSGLINSSFNSFSSSPESLGIVLLIGLTAGFSTCMALVGGLVLSASAKHAQAHPEATAAQKFRPHLYFNIGRVLGFSLLGGILGMIGSVFQLSSISIGLITVIVGTVMLLMGLQLVGIFPVINKIKIAFPKSLIRAIGIKNRQKEYSHKNAIILGVLTFFLPCGFTQAMQVYAVSTGSPIIGALVMGTFALGTAPGLLGIGGVASAVKGVFAKRFFKFSGLLVISFAIFNIVNGYNLTGWQLGPSESPKAVSSDKNKNEDGNVKQESEVQIVKMDQLAGGYSPSKFTVKKGVPVRWMINSKEPYSCASSITIPKLNISKKLSRGENVIEFTPTEAGALKFSCSMGMYTGIFNVI